MKSELRSTAFACYISIGPCSPSGGPSRTDRSEWIGFVYMHRQQAIFRFRNSHLSAMIKCSIRITAVVTAAIVAQETKVRYSSLSRFSDSNSILRIDEAQLKFISFDLGNIKFISFRCRYSSFIFRCGYSSIILRCRYPDIHWTPWISPAQSLRSLRLLQV